MPKKIREYSLCLDPDGAEVLYRSLPQFVDLSFTHFEGLPMRGGGYRRVNHVIVLELEDGSLIEETTIRSIKVNCGERFICPRPRGKGWQVHDEEHENFTIYRRPLPSGERTMFDHPDCE